MRCIEVNDLIQRELDSDLSEHEIVQLHQHIQVCSECNSFYERLRKVHMDLENLPKVSLPFSLVDSLLPEFDRIDREVHRTKIEPKVKKNWFMKHKWIPALSTAAAIFLVFFTIQQVNQHESEVANELVTNQPESVAMDSTGESVDLPTESMSGSFSITMTDPTVEKAGVEPPIDSATRASEPTVTEESADVPNNEVVVISDPILFDGEDIDEMAKHTLITSPGFTFTGNLENGDALQVMENIVSPDQKLVAYYTPTTIEIVTIDQQQLLLQLWAGEGESYSDLMWLDQSQLQYTQHTAESDQIWVIDVMTAEKWMKK